MKILNILIFLLIFNTFILLGYFASELTGKATYERVISNITRVIDGDTIDSDIGRVRLLGINTPEKNQPYYDEALNFLKPYEGRIIELEARGKDKYNRVLGYIYYHEKLINSEILREGYANLYVYDEDEHYGELINAEQEARDNGRGLWKKSVNYGCVEIGGFEPIDRSENDEEKLTLKNLCNVKISLIIKDNANHIYTETISSNAVLEKTFKDVFNDDGDSLIVRDNSGLLLFYRY